MESGDQRDDYWRRKLRESNEAHKKELANLRQKCEEAIDREVQISQEREQKIINYYRAPRGGSTKREWKRYGWITDKRSSAPKPEPTRDIDRELENKIRSSGHESPAVVTLLEQGASFDRVPSGIDRLLLDLFNKGDTASARFLLYEHEGLFHDVDKLLEDTVRKEGAIGNYRVFLLEFADASFDRIPSGVDKLLQDELEKADFQITNNIKYLIEYKGASMSRISCCLDKVLEKASAADHSFLRGRVDFLLWGETFTRLPIKFQIQLRVFRTELRLYDQDPPPVDSLLKTASPETLCEVVQYIRTLKPTIKIRDDKGVETDGTRWPKVVDCGPVKFLTKSIVCLKSTSSDKTTITTRQGSITASTAILRAQSSYFRTLIDDNSSHGGEDRSSFNFEETYKTIKFVIDYTETEPQNVNWLPFSSVKDAKGTTEGLNGLLDVLSAAIKLNMTQLHHDVQRQIVINGTSFIGLRNVSLVRDKAVKWDAKILSAYCDAFLKLNES